MVGGAQQTHGFFPTKNHQHLGFLGVPPSKETPLKDTPIT